jgi:hypothetical protein
VFFTVPRSHRLENLVANQHTFVIKLDLEKFDLRRPLSQQPFCLNDKVFDSQPTTAEKVGDPLEVVFGFVLTIRTASFLAQRAS